MENNSDEYKIPFPMDWAVDEKSFPSLVPQTKSDSLIDDEMRADIISLNKFAAQVLMELPTDPVNHSVSPICLYSSFQMLYIGSSDSISKDLQQFLYLSGESDSSLKTIQSVLQMLIYDQLELKPNYHWFKAIHFLIDKRVKITDNFKNSLKQHFNVDIKRIDFNKDFEVICDQISEVIRKELRAEHIKDFHIKINKWTQIIVLSSVRFKANWETNFPFNSIKDENFYCDPNKISKVKMMAIFGKPFPYIFCEKWDSHIVEIPLAEKSLSFVMILPKKRYDLTPLWTKFNYQSFMENINSLKECPLDLFLPKFKIECDYDFNTIFKYLKVFNENKMQVIGGNDNIKANNVIQKVILEINESGINSWIPKSKKLCDSIVVRADHPFIYLIIDNRTKAWLLCGQIHSF